VGWGVKGAWEEDVDEVVEEGEDVDMDLGETVGFGGPVGGVNGGAQAEEEAAGEDLTMGGMEDGDEEFEEAMGVAPVGGNNNG
jgi:transcription initiation factor TFIID subunit 9B